LGRGPKNDVLALSVLQNKNTFYRPENTFYSTEQEQKPQLPRN
jgi:hypothetical protein